MTTTPLSPTELREREQDRQWLANRCAEVEARGVRETYLPRDRTTDLERVFRLVRELLSAPAAPREREKTFEDGIEAAAKVAASYEGQPESEYGAGERLAADQIERRIRALAPSTTPSSSTSGGK